MIGSPGQLRSWLFEGLEPYEGKLSRTVLRGAQGWQQPGPTRCSFTAVFPFDSSEVHRVRLRASLGVATLDTMIIDVARNRGQECVHEQVQRLDAGLRAGIVVVVAVSVEGYAD